MQTDTDVIVIGGGPAGAHASLPLVEAGLSVIMLDGGTIAQEDHSSHTGDFETIRREDPQQHELFLGKDLSDIAPTTSQSHAQSMIGGKRAHVSRHTETHLPVKTGDSFLLQSLAKGGLSESWGAVCSIYDEAELEAIGIPAQEMPEHYRAVIEQIGVSGETTGYPVQPPTEVDSRAKRLLDRFSRMNVTTKGLALSRSLLAVLTKPLGARGALSYRDLEYTTNDGDAIYRARFTIEELEKKDTFTYVPERIVSTIQETDSTHVVIARDLAGKEYRYTAKRIVLAAGAINTTRILLKSFEVHDVPVPFLVKQNILIPCLDFRSIGRADDARRHSLCQLVIKDSEKTARLPASFAQVNSYKSLLLFRLARYLPLPMPEALSLLSIWTPSLIIIDVRFPVFEDTENAYRYDAAHLTINMTRIAHNDHTKALKRLRGFLRSLGLMPLKTVVPPLGASSHYAGGIPFETTPRGQGLSVKKTGELIQRSGVYVADSASWRALPAESLALSIMANARRVGTHVVSDLRKKN